MKKVNWLPSYARPGAMVVFDKSTLSKGHLQAEALTYFKMVGHQFAPEDLKEAFQAIITQYPGAKEAQGEFALKDNFLVMTVALALLKDIGPLAPYITYDNVPLGSVSSYIKDLSAGLEIDLVDQLTRKGDLELKMFCMVYSVKAEDLAVKAVLDDNPAAYAVFQRESPEIALKALARVPYDPLSAIRAHIGKPANEISFEEMESRIRNQFTLFLGKEYLPLINPAKPSNLQPLGELEYEAIDAPDHQLRSLPCYLPALAAHQDELMPRFGAYSRQINSTEAGQVKIIGKLIDDMEKAGMTRIDILMKGVLNYNPYSTDLHWMRPPQELKTQYLAMSPEQRGEMYLPMLLDNAAHYGDDPKGWQSQSKLLQLNHFLSREPIETLEALCTSGSHWNALYRVTGDRKYVAKLGDRVDKVFGEDLGL